jgi:hypothetical protein
MWGVLCVCVGGGTASNLGGVCACVKGWGMGERWMCNIIIILLCVYTGGCCQYQSTPVHLEACGTDRY